MSIQDEVHAETGHRPSYTRLSQLISARWKKITPTEKAYYQQLAAKDKRRFALESIQWKLQNEKQYQNTKQEAKVPVDAEPQVNSAMVVSSQLIDETFASSSSNLELPTPPVVNIVTPQRHTQANTRDFCQPMANADNNDVLFGDGELDFLADFDFPMDSLRMLATFQNDVSFSFWGNRPYKRLLEKLAHCKNRFIQYREHT